MLSGGQENGRCPLSAPRYAEVRGGEDTVRLVLLEARNLSLGALVSVSLVIRRGDLTAILGPPGSGKTTLLRLLGFQNRPAAGLLLWKGRLVTSTPGAELAELLLADEPPPGAMPRLLALHRLGQTVVIATADPGVAAVCPTIYCLSRGRIRPLTSI